jgi:hypothetical protein
MSRTFEGSLKKPTPRRTASSASTSGEPWLPPIREAPNTIVPLLEGYGLLIDTDNLSVIRNTQERLRPTHGHRYNKAFDASTDSGILSPQQFALLLSYFADPVAHARLTYRGTELQPCQWQVEVGVEPPSIVSIERDNAIDFIEEQCGGAEAVTEASVQHFLHQFGLNIGQVVSDSEDAMPFDSSPQLPPAGAFVRRGISNLLNSRSGSYAILHNIDADIDNDGVLEPLYPLPGVSAAHAVEEEPVSTQRSIQIVSNATAPRPPSQVCDDIHVQEVTEKRDASLSSNSASGTTSGDGDVSHDSFGDHLSEDGAVTPVSALLDSCPGAETPTMEMSISGTSLSLSKRQRRVSKRTVDASTQTDVCSFTQLWLGKLKDSRGTSTRPSGDVGKVVSVALLRRHRTQRVAKHELHGLKGKSFAELSALYKSLCVKGKSPGNGVGGLSPPFS